MATRTGQKNQNQWMEDEVEDLKVLMRGLSSEGLDTENLPELHVYSLGQDKHKNPKHNNGSIRDYLTKFGFKIMSQAGTGGY